MRRAAPDTFPAAAMRRIAATIAPFPLPLPRMAIPAPARLPYRKPHAGRDYWVVDEWLTHNLYVQYEFEQGPLEGTRLRIGAKNITDEEPPMANQRYGYDGRLHSNRGRWWYATIRRSF